VLLPQLLVEMAHVEIEIVLAIEIAVGGHSIIPARAFLKQNVVKNIRSRVEIISPPQDGTSAS
jgi:hypothetical protein